MKLESSQYISLVPKTLCGRTRPESSRTWRVTLTTSRKWGKVPMQCTKKVRPYVSNETKLLLLLFNLHKLPTSLFSFLFLSQL